MRNSTRVWAAAAVVGLAGVVGGAQAAVKTFPVAIRTIEVTAPAGYHVYRTPAEWSAGQGRLPASQRQWMTLPGLPWEREMVISASMGERRTSGYQARITSVARVGNEIVVKVSETSPARDAVTAQVITYPSHTVAVKWMVGPVVFVVNGERRPEGSGPVSRPPATGVSRPRGDAANLATSLFILRETGGLAGWDRQTIVHLYGRPVQQSEIFADVRESRTAQTGGPLIRMAEQTIRDSGFLRLNDRYTASRPVADGITRTIRVQIGGTTKTVSAEQGANVPKAFTDTWDAIETVINSRGTMVPPWGASDRNAGPR